MAYFIPKPEDIPSSDLQFKEFDLKNRQLSELEIKETNKSDKCLIWDTKERNVCYNKFLLSINTKSKIICQVSFYESSNTKRYICRLKFERQDLQGNTKISNKVIIDLTKSEISSKFWELISFLSSYQDLVDTGDFQKSYQVISKDSYFLEFDDKEEKEKIQDLKELVGKSDLTYNQFKEIAFELRKSDLKVFFDLLKSDEERRKYSEKNSIQGGEEYVWQHFLKGNDWILGLNTDIRFISDLLAEKKGGSENADGKGSPRVDIIGLTEFVTLIELKQSSESIFKKNNSKRTGKWDFTSGFIEGISQCLGQKSEFDSSHKFKEIDNDEGETIDFYNVDVPSILIIGNKKNEFPIDKKQSINIIKVKTLERFRRNSRNINILTYDELFERAYNIVYSKKLDINWYQKTKEEIFID